MSLSQPLGQVLTPKRSHLAPALLLVFGLLVAVSAATYGYIESRRVERVVIAVRTVAFGQPISADDLGTIELPLHRPIQLAGITDPSLVIGRWAAREIGANDVVQPTMLLTAPPDQPVYPSGQQLDKDTVPVPFTTTTIGPLTVRDLVNIGFNDPSGDPQLCVNSGGTLRAVPEPAATDGVGVQKGRPYACRLLQRLKVLYVDEGKGLAYLQMTPYQAHTIWALQAASLPLWGERYGASSDALPTLDRLDASQLSADRLTMTLTDTLRLYGDSGDGRGGSIPGTRAVPGPAPTVRPTK